MSNTTMLTQIRDIDDVQSAVRDARKALPVGAGTKPALSRIPEDVQPIAMRGLSGIVEYEPAEYTITALAGTLISELESALRSNGQFLPFDPVFVQAGATVGGTVASGLSGSGRLRYGGIRDFILGARFVDGQGVLIRGGGKVVKNAAGFDFPKLLVGSMGRLGIVIDTTFKVFPRPPAYATIFTQYPILNDALADMQTLSVSPIELFAVDLVAPTGSSPYTLATRIGGSEELLADRTRRLCSMLPTSEIIEGAEESAYWGDIGEFSWTDPQAALVKIPMTPARIQNMENALASAERPRRYAVAGNVLWLTWTEPLGSLDGLLADQALTGVVLRGDIQHPLIGLGATSAFAGRITAAIDPDSKFLPHHRG